MSAQLKRIVVYDFGGGTLDVSVLSIEGGVITVLGTDGNTHLGGQDIDKILLEHCLADFLNKTGISLSSNKRA